MSSHSLVELSKMPDNKRKRDDGLLADSRDVFLQKLRQLTTAGGDHTGLTEMPVEEEDTDATADNELTVDDDNFDGDEFLM